MSEEWHPEPPIDWSKETRCTPCRVPQPSVTPEHLRYTPVSCRDCKYIDVKNCSECGDEMGLCTYYSRSPPHKDLDKKQKCVWYKKR